MIIENSENDEKLIKTETEAVVKSNDVENNLNSLSTVSVSQPEIFEESWQILEDLGAFELDKKPQPDLAQEQFDELERIGAFNESKENNKKLNEV